MRPRGFTALAGGAIAWPLTARALQNVRGPRSGLVYPGQQAGAQLRVNAFLDGLRAGDYPQCDLP